MKIFASFSIRYVMLAMLMGTAAISCSEVGDSDDINVATPDAEYTRDGEFHLESEG